MTKLKELGVSFVRTSLVPPVAGFILAWIAENRWEIDSTWVFTIVSFILSGLWYLVFRLLEILSENPKIRRLAGIFLGSPNKPTY